MVAFSFFALSPGPLTPNPSPTRGARRHSTTRGAYIEVYLLGRSCRHGPLRVWYGRFTTEAQRYFNHREHRGASRRLAQITALSKSNKVMQIPKKVTNCRGDIPCRPNPQAAAVSGDQICRPYGFGHRLSGGRGWDWAGAVQVFSPSRGA